MIDAMGDDFGNPHSSEHAFGWRAANAVAAAATQVGSLVGADADEVIFTSGATEANNLALLGIADHAKRSGRRRIVLSAIEHKSVLAAGRALSLQHECEVVSAEVDELGRIDLEQLEALLGHDTLLVSIMAVNNEIGTIEDIERIAALSRRAGALFHCDAAQAPCAFDVAALMDHTDLLSLSAHKIYGPCGVGALVVRRDIQPMLSPIIHGGGQQNGLRSGTLPLSLCIGFAAAAELLRSSDAIAERDRIRSVRDLFVETIATSGCAFAMNGPLGDGRHPGNANLTFSGFAAADLLAAMQPMIAASSGSACTSGIPEPSHVLKAIGKTAEESDSSVRFSFGRFSTEDDAQRAAAIVSSTLRRLTDAELFTADKGA